MIVHIQTQQPTSSVALPITIELHITRGIRWHMTGALHHSIKENQKRVYTAVKNCGWHWPGQRINTNFIPLDLPKMGTHYDLPLAVGILAGSGQIPTRHLSDTLFTGALELEGRILPCQNPFSVLHLAKKLGKTYVMTAFDQQDYHHLVKRFPEVKLLQVNHLREVTRALTSRTLTNASPSVPEQPMHSATQLQVPALAQNQGCFSEVHGQHKLKRMLEIAAAGGHHALMIGPPGVGKTMLAERFAGILPSVNPFQQSTISLLADSNSNSRKSALRGIRPVHLCFGASRKDLFGSIALQKWHHLWKSPLNDTWEFMAKDVGLKGELGLFQKSIGGTLFMDEFTSYPKAILDTLIHHADAHQVQLLLAMNPCACGNFNHPKLKCHCAPSALSRHQSKMTGAWKDRIELIQYTEVHSEEGEGHSSAQILDRTTKAWTLQIQRQEKQNAQLTRSELDQQAQFSKSTRQYFRNLHERHSLSIRAQTGLLSVARTIADLDYSTSIEREHIDEALELRIGSKDVLSTPEASQKAKGRSITLGKNIKVRMRN